MAQILKIAGLIALGLVSLLGVGLLFVLNDRPNLSRLTPFAAPVTEAADDGVTVTWLGASTLMFEDGETVLLVDGFVSRPSLLAQVIDRPIAPDRAAIERVRARFGLHRLSAVLLTQGDITHGFDAGTIARDAGARVLGSSTAVQLALGAGVSAERVAIADPARVYRFGAFSVEFIRAPAVFLGGGEDKPGLLNPLTPPAPPSAWVRGDVYAVRIGHYRGAALIHAGSGVDLGMFDGIDSDAVFIGLRDLPKAGTAERAAYWDEAVGRTGATRVFPIQYDDVLTQPFGVVRAPPRLTGDMGEVFDQFLRFAQTDSVRFEQLRFGVQTPLY
ncbi:MAG: MBL fold metallo-hydrolase [Maricaulaceae bacterium]